MSHTSFPTTIFRNFCQKQERFDMETGKPILDMAHTKGNREGEKSFRFHFLKMTEALEECLDQKTKIPNE